MKNIYRYEYKNFPIVADIAHIFTHIVKDSEAFLTVSITGFRNNTEGLKDNGQRQVSLEISMDDVSTNTQWIKVASFIDTGENFTSVLFPFAAPHYFIGASCIRMTVASLSKVSCTYRMNVCEFSNPISISTEGVLPVTIVSPLTDEGFVPVHVEEVG